MGERMAAAVYWWSARAPWRPCSQRCATYLTRRWKARAYRRGRGRNLRAGGKGACSDWPSLILQRTITLRTGNGNGSKEYARCLPVHASHAHPLRPRGTGLCVILVQFSEPVFVASKWQILAALAMVQPGRGAIPREVLAEVSDDT